jgi:hypothetical protein
MRPCRHNLSKLAAASIALLVLSGEVAAQDAHYWTLQYGNRARLLGGAVIGSVLDISAVYYNPGALSLTEAKGLLLAGNVFEFRSLTWKDALGEGRDLIDSKFGSVPSLFAGEFRFGFLGDHRLAYSFLTRQTFSARLTATGVESEPLPDFPNVGTLAANVNLEQDMNEFWAGLTWSHTLGAHLGLGVSTFLAVRNQRTEFSTTAELVGTDTNQAAASLLGRDYDFQDWRLLWKIGLAAKFEKWELGLNVTTPSVGLWGSGSAGSNDAEIVQNVDTSESPELPRVAVDFQDGVSATYESPLSIGAGAAYRFGSTKLYASAEWFARVDPYRVLDTQPFIGQTSGDTLIFNVVADADQVLNWGVGVEHNFNERTGIYGSFATDFSSAAPESEANTSITFWNLYHASLGTTFTVGRSVWTLGGILGFGGQTVEGVDLIPGNDEIGQALEETQLSVISFTFILGFELAFQ